MKKFLIVSVVLLCAVSAFAFKNSIVVNTFPCVVQITTTSNEAEGSIRSVYGIGADVLYQRYFTKRFFVEGGIGWTTILLEDERPSTTSLTGFVGAGYKIHFAEEFSLYAHADFAEDSMIYKGKVSEGLGVKVGAGMCFDLCERFSINLACDGLFRFNKDEKAKYVDYRILPTLGFGINL